MPTKLRSRLIKPFQRATYLPLVVAVAAFAGVGAFLLNYSQAATSAIPAEAENGTLVTAKSMDSSGASGGKAVLFQPGTTGGGSGNEMPAGVSGNWTRIFTDEFNGTSLDKTKWDDNWFGQTNMNGFEKLASNIRFSNGSVILGIGADDSGAVLTSNPYNSNNIKGGFTFGTGIYLEARINFAGNGETVYNWPAWWTNSYNWPMTGETDIFEALGESATSNYHYGSDYSNHTANNSGPIPGVWANAYHTYGLYRKANKNEIYWDGKLIRSYDTHDGGAEQYLMLTSGTNGPDWPSVTGSQADMKVDYVRAWRAN